VTEFDLAIIGGGINGVGIARDAAGRGLKVLLVEQNDLASGTSSASSKLIHGGLRYLEHGALRLVRAALAEREVLLRMAPHLIRPLRFVLPLDEARRSPLLIRLGLFIYDRLGRREILPPSRGLDLITDEAGQPLKRQFHRAFEYSDCFADDSRLVVLNAVDAAERGATIRTRTRCVRAERGPRGWRLVLTTQGLRETATARVLVNAAGPWAEMVTDTLLRQAPKQLLRLDKGSHLVVHRLYDHDRAYILQTADGRVVFTIPFERDFTLIGTTDVEHHGAVGGAKIDESEIRYLCEQASRYFARPVGPSDVVWTYSGVRPLLDDESGDPSAVTRDYSLDLDTAQAPLLTVWGGKITTFRRLAEDAADMLMGPLGTDQASGAWTHGAFLPGGDLDKWIGPARRPDTDFERFEQTVRRRYPQFDAAVLHRLARAYGARIDRVLSGPPGVEVAPGLFECELRYLHDHEWARSADDVLWRRSKLGLHFSAEQRAAVAAWCAAHWSGAAVTSTPETAWN